jgi:GTP-binding protein
VRPEIAFVGRSNVGKSSLLNALAARRGLARTSRTPGKTTMCNVFALDDACYYVDLPGYGYARLSRGEREALARLIEAYLASHRPGGVVWLLDLRRDPSPEDLAMRDLLVEHSVRALIALTKVDTVPRGRRDGRLRTVLAQLALEGAGPPCLTSARSGEGVPELRRAIARLVAREADDA